ncbi:protein THEM6-like [Anoplophora glabripennis]|uniref:protein THEM6-like n=1 Tax=Anoplophora glabripennis TaxID=217634 RepID=UPI00087425D6|nr:protein THEM6-like [Anoplophora glabripennis]
MDLCYLFFGCVGFILVLYCVLELHYFLRTMVCVIWARITKKRVYILDETKVGGICLTTDIDNLLNHMNNARYIRELDFAKIDFNERTGLYQKIKSCGGSIVLGATTIRYRRFIKLFNRYHITTKIVYWDDQNIYMEHRFITPSENFINAIVLCKTRLTNCNADQIITDLIVSSSNCDVESAKSQKPEISAELAKWIESNEISSALLRKV